MHWHRVRKMPYGGQRSPSHSSAVSIFMKNYVEILGPYHLRKNPNEDHKRSSTYASPQQIVLYFIYVGPLRTLASAVLDSETLTSPAKVSLISQERLLRRANETKIKNMHCVMLQQRSKTCSTRSHPREIGRPIPRTSCPVVEFRTCEMLHGHTSKQSSSNSSSV